jgi:hypothetical protein
MSKKIGIGIIDCFGEDAYAKCKAALPAVDEVYRYHIPAAYMSYGGMYNYILRDFYDKKVDYIFLIKSTVILNDSSLINDYINTAKNFGTWFMTRGRREAPFSTIEDDITKQNLHLFTNLYNDLIFMVKGFIDNIGYFNEGYTNFSGNDDINTLELYDYYKKIETKINYLPLGFFPDTEWSLTKSTIIHKHRLFDNHLMKNTQDNLSKVFGKFYYLNKFAPGQHITAKKEDAFSILEKIQLNYSIKE